MKNIISLIGIFAAFMFAANAHADKPGGDHTGGTEFTTEVKEFMQMYVLDSVTAIPLEDLLDTNSGNGYLGQVRVISNVDYTLTISYDGIKINGVWYGKFVNDDGEWIAARVFYDPLPGDSSTAHLVYASPASNDNGAINVDVNKDATGGRNKIFNIGADVVPTKNSFADELPDAGLYKLPVSISIGKK